MNRGTLSSRSLRVFRSKVVAATASSSTRVARPQFPSTGPLRAIGMSSSSANSSAASATGTSLGSSSCRRSVTSRRRFSTDAGPEITKFPGAQTAYTTKLEFRDKMEPFDCFRVTDNEGTPVDPEYTPCVDDPTLVKMYETMVTLNVMDGIFYDAQRQGRISFYMTCYGEEAIHIGAAAALQDDDELFCQYRETGFLMWRGFSLKNFANQCFSNDLDLGKGRQMPIHYGSKKLHFQTISSPLSTQLPQAVGAAYSFKQDKNGRVAVCVFGEGAASEGDFHAAFNFATTLSCPVVFICRNNGYAISTPSNEQYAGDGIAARGPGYGMHTVRVDGMDTLAVYEAVAASRKLAAEENKPVLVECMTYRGGHHSTSDDSTRYRSAEEIQWWLEEMSPLTRMRMLLESRALWDSEREANLREEKRKELLAGIAQAETRKFPALNQLFTDVYDNVPKHLQEQQRDMLQHVDKYPEHYKLDVYQPADEYTDPAACKGSDV